MAALADRQLWVAHVSKDIVPIQCVKSKLLGSLVARRSIELTSLKSMVTAFAGYIAAEAAR